MIPPCFFVLLKARLGNPYRHDSQMRIKAAKQHPQYLRTCRQHGILPGFWQPASVHGRPFCMACSSQSDISCTPSIISSIVMACRGIGIPVALPCAEEMFAMRLALAITACFILRWLLCGSCFSIQPGCLRSRCCNIFGCPGAGSIGRK